MEKTYTRTQAERLEIIRALKDNGLWTLVVYIPRANNNYYLFESNANPGETIAVNDGPGDFYEDVVYCN